MQEHVTKILAKILWTGDAAVAQAVVDADAVPKLVALPAIDHSGVQAQAVRAVAHITWKLLFKLW